MRRVLISGRVLATAAGLLIGAASVIGSAPTAQADSGSIYDQPTSFAGTQPGQVLKSQPVTIQQVGIPVPYQAWQVQYVTADTNGNPQADVATVVKPQTGSGQLLSYQPAIDSLAAACQPSHTLVNSPVALQDKTFAGEESFAAITDALASGYTVVISDYEGPRFEWTAGIEAGRGTLDGIRAAESFAPLGLAGSATKVAMMGYSGGSQATEFAAELAPTYAPELHIVAAALGGLPVNIAHIAANVNGGPYAGVYFAAAFGISRAYPQIDVDSLLNDAGKKLKQDIGGMCISQFVPTYAGQKIEQYTVNGVDPLTLSPVQQVAAADQMGVVGVPRIPMHIWMADYDGLVVTADVDPLVTRYCSAGTKIEYVKYPVADHLSAAAEGIPAAEAYLASAFAGATPLSTC